MSEEALIVKLESSEVLVKTQIARPGPQRQSCSRSGARPENLYFKELPGDAEAAIQALRTTEQKD